METRPGWNQDACIFRPVARAQSGGAFFDKQSGLLRMRGEKDISCATACACARRLSTTCVAGGAYAPFEPPWLQACNITMVMTFEP